MSLTEIERRWLSHAWAVFHTPSDHFAVCPGVQADTRDALDLDPGYVGANYPALGGGVVCVGLADGKAEGRARPSRTTPRRQVAEDWVLEGVGPIADPIAAEQFLDRWRESFLDDLDRWPWWRKHFDEIIRFAGRRQDDVAVVNLAVCRQRTDGEGVKLAMACSKQYPIATTIATFQPAALLVAGKDSWVASETAALANFVEHWNAMIPTQGHADAQNWRAQVGRHVREAVDSWDSSPSNPEVMSPPGAAELSGQVDGATDARPIRLAALSATDEREDQLGPRFVPGRSGPGIERGLVDVVVDLDLLADRTGVHEQLVEELHAIVSAAGHPTFARSVGPDLSWREGGRVVVAEVKTLPVDFDRHQLRLGLGQVLEYRSAAAAGLGQSVSAVLWVEHAPNDAVLWQETCDSVGVRLGWPGGPTPMGS